MIKFKSKVGIKHNNSKSILIPISDLRNGINSTEDFFIKKEKNQIEWIVDRLCDHNYGKLIIKKNEVKYATCPVHNWNLDLNTLKYTNKIGKKRIKFKIKNENIEIKQSKKSLDFKISKKVKFNNNKVYIRYLSHASVLITYDGINIVTDPWFFGPAFCNGWWLKEYPKFNIDSIINKIDYIYISHNHPDHLHIETLKKFNKETKIITPKFASNSTKSLIKRLGFKNIYDLNFNNIYKIKNDKILFTILKSGDFRDDSGIFFQINGKKILLNVDCNNLNCGVLPEKIDLLMSSFAGGASGFPLCFEDYNEEEKKRILIRNKKSLLSMVTRLIKITKCKYFMPYAGYFSEKAERDEFILNNNQKNSFEELSKVSNIFDCKVINFEKHDTIVFGKKTELKQNNIIKKNNKSEKNEIKNYITSTKKIFSELSIDYIKNYFINSGFKENLLLYVIPTNDNFKFLEYGYLIDFSGDKVLFKSTNSKTIFNKFNKNIKSDKKHLLIKVRKESLNMVLSNKLPWEDLLIGFQCRITRKPNIYNARFWQHFTNNYIDKVNFRYKNPCGSCEILFQKVY